MTTFRLPVGTDISWRRAWMIIAWRAVALQYIVQSLNESKCNNEDYDRIHPLNEMINYTNLLK